MKLTIPTSDFNLEATLDSGQVFGFEKSEGVYSGQINGHVLSLLQEKETLVIQGERLNLDFKNRIRHYFDLDRDLKLVYQLIKEENQFSELTSRLKGLRLLRQDSWEALACFIISSNNNVKRIQGIWKNLTDQLGSDGRFPTARQISASHERMLRQCGLGYRAPFLLRSAQFIAINPACLDVIHQAPYEEAKDRVLRFPGVGPKVADCILLYGFQKFEAFPVDVWIYRVMKKAYFQKRSVNEEEIHRFAQKRWGNWAGYVQQYLFHGARMGILSFL